MKYFVVHAKNAGKPVPFGEGDNANKSWHTTDAYSVLRGAQKFQYLYNEAIRYANINCVTKPDHVNLWASSVGQAAAFDNISAAVTRIHDVIQQVKSNTQKYSPPAYDRYSNRFVDPKIQFTVPAHTFAIIDELGNFVSAVELESALNVVYGPGCWTHANAFQNQPANRGEQNVEWLAFPKKATNKVLNSYDEDEDDLDEEEDEDEEEASFIQNPVKKSSKQASPPVKPKEKKEESTMSTKSVATSKPASKISQSLVTLGGNVFETLKEDAEDAGVRVVCRKSVRATKKGALKLLKSRGADVAVVETFARFLDSEDGETIVGMCLGSAIPVIPQLSDNPMALRAAKEFRTEAISRGMESLLDSLTAFIVPALSEVFTDVEIPGVTPQKKASKSKEKSTTDELNLPRETEEVYIPSTML